MTQLRGPLASTGYWLKVSALAYLRELDAALRPLALTSAQFSVLAGVGWLSKIGVAPTQQQVADFAGVDRMMTSKLLRLLESRKLVKRVATADDARVRRIELTPAGRAMIVSSTEAAKEVDRRLFGAQLALRDLLIERFAQHGGLIDGASPA